MPKLVESSWMAAGGPVKTNCEKLVETSLVLKKLLKLSESSWMAASGGNAEPWLPAAAPWRPMFLLKPPQNPHPDTGKSSYKLLLI